MTLEGSSELSSSDFHVPEDNQVSATNITGSTFQLVTNKRNKRTRHPSDEEFNVHKAKIPHKLPVQEIPLKNHFSQHKEMLLNDPTVPASSKTFTNIKKIVTPKTRFITIKSPTNRTELMKKLASDNCNFTIAPAGAFTKIFPTTPADYSNIIKILDDIKIEHFLFPESSTIPFKVVIRGLPIDTSEDEIIEELKLMNYQVIKVTQMRKLKNNNLMPLFQIQLENSPKSKEILKIEKFLFYIVKIEIYNKPSRTLQCFSCQYFHHASHQCKMQPRCVKCAGGHKSMDCPLGKGKIEQVKCCNCSGTHAASFRGCPKFPENKKKFNSTPVSATFSYANAVAPKIAPQQSSTQVTSHEILDNKGLSSLSELSNVLNEIAKEFNVPNFNELVHKYKIALEKIRNEPNPMNKLTLLLGVFDLPLSLAP